MGNQRFDIQELAKRADLLEQNQKEAIDAAFAHSIPITRPFDEGAYERGMAEQTSLYEASETAGRAVTRFWSDLDDDTVDTLVAHRRARKTSAEY